MVIEVNILAPLATMTRCIKFGSHTLFQLKTIPVTSLDIVIPILEIFGFVLYIIIFVMFVLT